MNRIQERISTLEKCANEAYANSTSLGLIYSSNPRVKTRTSEAKRYASLMGEIARAKFVLSCIEIEEKLPDFNKMSTDEIQTWAEGGDPLHWFPCGMGDEECVILLEDRKYYLSVVRYSQEGWIAEARGVRITPHISKVLTSKGFNTVEY